MPQSIVTYNTGMMKDQSYLKFPQTSYEDARNFRFVTDEGASTGALVNERGNRLDFCFPTVHATYSFQEGDTITIDGTSTTVSTLVDLQSTFSDEIDAGEFNFYENGDEFVLILLNSAAIVSGMTQITDTYTEVYPIGWTHMDDAIIIFTTANDGDGQIWMVEYNEQTNTIDDLDDQGCLTPSVHLKYNSSINLSTDHAITRAITRYENDSIARVYWTDFNNPVRSFNLLDPNGFGVDPDDIDLLNNVSLSQPTITSIQSGGEIPYGAMIQMGYRLLGQGSQTVVSPFTNLLPVYDDPSDSYVNITGQDSGEGASKSISFSIDNIDTNYDEIEYIFLIYETEDAPTIVSYIESIPTSGSVTGSFANNENGLTDLTELDINQLASEFNLAKDIAIKDNRLIAANLKLSNFEITDEEFDARAYRFDENGVSTIYESNGTSTIVPTDFDVDYESDAINPFNHDQFGGGDFKYKSDGVTLGGEGANISYTFITQEFLGDEERDQQIPWAGPRANSRQDVSFQASDYSVENTATNQYNNHVSPFVTQWYTGYHRDEVYRFAIVFYSKKGEISFAKWIGDIKFPTVCEMPFTDGSVFDDAGGNDTCSIYSLGIQFEVNIPDTISDKIQGYEIVRVEREYADQTRIGGGAMLPVQGSSNDVYSSLITAGKEGFDDFNEGGTNNEFQRLRRFAFPSRLIPGLSSYSYETGDYLKLEMGYRYSLGTDLGTDTYANSETFIYNSPTDGDNDTGEISVVKRYNPVCYTTPIEVDVDGEYIVGYNSAGGSFTLTSAGFEVADYNTYINDATDGSTAGFTQVLYLANDFALEGIGGYDDRQMPYATYCRNITNQYGGDTYEARSLNSYVSTGSFVSTNTDTTVDVYGGDTYITYFMHETHLDIGNADADEDYAKGVGFVCEAVGNTELSMGRYFQKDRQNPAISQQEFEDSAGDDGAYERTYNLIYSQQPNAKELYVGENFLSNTETEFPFTIWASELKTNGELVDSWGSFLTNNQRDVEGIYGEINNITVFKDKVFFYQNQAFGVITINERVAIADSDSSELLIGTGDVVAEFVYVSRHTGAQHRQAVIPSENYIYHYDQRQKKLWQYTIGSKSPLSDIKGLNSYFYESTYGTTLEDTDSPTSLDSASNIHGAYDHRYNRVLFTFKSPTYNETVSFNELTGHFESFYDFQPKMYLSTGRKLLSVSPETNNTIYQHGLGDYGVFYDEDPSDSSVAFIVNGGNHINKVWGNLVWLSEFTTDDDDDVLETFDLLQISNDYQDTGQLVLTEGDNLQQRFRHWRHAVQRNTASDNQNDRIRNPWIRLELTKYNDKDGRFVIHDVESHFLMDAINDYKV